MFRRIYRTLRKLWKNRVFYRGLRHSGYDLRNELARLRRIPRVTKAKDLKFEWGPQYYNARILNPESGTSQVLYAHFIVLAPGGRSQKHGHMNEAMFYILDGKGHEIHDGVRHDWESGDLVVVENATVHQHFNDDPEHPARAIIIKSKPLYLFMNMVMQADVEKQPSTPSAGHEKFQPTVFDQPSEK